MKKLMLVAVLAISTVGLASCGCWGGSCCNSCMTSYMSTLGCCGYDTW